MPPEQSKFIRQLKITLIAILGPFILSISVVEVQDHFALKHMRNHIEVLEETYVSQDILLLYLNELRQYNKLLRTRMEGNEAQFADKLNMIDKRLDDLMRQVYTIQIRGGNKPEPLTENMPYP